MKKRRKNKRQQDKHKEYVLPTAKEQLIILAFALIFLFVSLYLALRPTDITEDELISRQITLRENPVYDIYTIKSTTYRDIILRVYEYKREFKITSMVYKAVNHNDFQKDIRKGDKITVKVLKSEVDNLNEHTWMDDYNDVYGIMKEGKSYINLHSRNKLANNDKQYAYIFALYGLIFIPYIFFKKKPMIGIEAAVGWLSLLILIVMLIIN